MVKTGTPIIYRMTQADVTAGLATPLSGGFIEIIDASNIPTGVIYQTGAAGVTPSQLETSSTLQKHNFTAIIPPTINDDFADGYSVGSRWVDVTNNESYICVDSTIGFAVWSQTTVGTIAEVSGLQTVLDVKEILSNKVTTLSSSSTDTQYPSAKLLFDQFAKRSLKEPCRAATTANINLNADLNNGDILDGVTLATGNRVLVKNQTTASGNGIYIVTATGAGTRAIDFDATPAGEVESGSIIPVSEGTVNIDSLWILTTNGAITVGTTALAFAKLSVSQASLDAKVNITDIINNLTTTTTTVPLSAAQGKVLQDAKSPLTSPTFTGTVVLPNIPTIVQTALDLKSPLTSPSFTGTPLTTTAVAGTNTTQIASTAFVKSAIDTAVTGLLDFRGNHDASGNVFPTTGGSGTSGAILKGDTWIISVAGTLGIETVEAGDLILAEIDTPGSTQVNWSVINKNIVYTPVRAVTTTVLAFPATATQGIVAISAAVETGELWNGFRVYRRTVRGRFPNNNTDINTVNGVSQSYLLQIGTAGELLLTGGWIDRPGATQRHLLKDLPNNGSHISGIYLGLTSPREVRMWNSMGSDTTYNNAQFEAFIEYHLGVA